MIKKLKINLDRLKYLTSYFNLTEDEVLTVVNDGVQKKITSEEIFTGELKLSHLKKIDKIFAQGLSFYTDPQQLEKRSSASIFFRKKQFNNQLKLGDKKCVGQMQGKILSLLTFASLADFKIERELKIFSTKDDPKDTALAIRKKLNIAELSQKNKNDKAFLTSLISALAKKNVLVHEFTETWNQKHKTTLDGFFIAPFHIIIKRQQATFKREIFTLAHELGHYLLNKEEIDKLWSPAESTTTRAQKNDETWVNTFAYSFLVGERDGEITKAFHENPFRNNEEISILSQQLHISRLAIFTNLLLNKKIGQEKYAQLKAALDQEYKKKQNQKDLKKKNLQALGKKQQGMPSKAIFSPLEESIYRHAFFEGVIEEYDVIKAFKPNHKQIENGYIDRFLERSIND